MRTVNEGRASEVLVAEDDIAVRESLVRGLRLEGYEVRAVADGLAAIEAVAEREPDLVVLDVMMPIVDGLTACRRIRARSRTLPILILTAYPSNGKTSAAFFKKLPNLFTRDRTPATS